MARAGVGLPAVLVVDLTREELDGAGDRANRCRRTAALTQMTRTLGFYAHVDAAVRERAERAGFDLVVPRSRMAREGPQLVERLAGA